MKVRPAEGAHIPSTDAFFSRRSFLAGMAGFHKHYNIVLSGMRQAQRQQHDTGAAMIAGRQTTSFRSEEIP
jgi:hypothetical protein